MARRPRMSSEAKAAKKEQKEAANANNLAADALLCFPTDPEKFREEFVDVVAQLRVEKAEAAGALSSHGKRVDQLYRSDSWLRSRVTELVGMKDGLRQRRIRQLTYAIKVLGLDNQLDLFNETAEPGGVAPEDAATDAVFDSSAAGETVAAERSDDPGRARKRTSAPPAPTPTPNVGVEGLAAGIKPLSPKDEAKAAARKKADKYFEPQGDKGLGEGGYH